MNIQLRSFRLRIFRLRSRHLIFLSLTIIFVLALFSIGSRSSPLAPYLLKVGILFGPPECPSERPVKISVYNYTMLTIYRYRVIYGAHREGHSNVGFRDEYETDEILHPFSSRHICIDTKSMYGPNLIPIDLIWKGKIVGARTSSRF